MPDFYTSTRPREVTRLIKSFFLLLPVLLIAITGCQNDKASRGLPAPDEDNGGLVMPDGFRALVVQGDTVGTGRHLTVHENGDIYMKLRWQEDDGHLVAMRDSTGDGRMDIVTRFGDPEPGARHSGVQMHNGYLYYSTDLHVYRYSLEPGELLPSSPPDTIVVDDHEHGIHQHITKPLAFDGRGNLYIPFGAPSDVCEQPRGAPGAKGEDPCSQLEQHGGIWKFSEDKRNQVQSEGIHYATGLRSVVALDWNPVSDELYLVQHGRDHLHRNWRDYYSAWESAILPSEELFNVSEGDDFGWPYCFYDHLKGKKVLAPEYGGDSEKVGRCAEVEQPLVAFPGHYAPNDLLFYKGDQFPERYKNGAFIAFHGSTIRAPYPQGGYFVGFIPFENGRPTGEWEVFANGFAVIDPVVSTRDAYHRPMGLAEGPDGSLYISDSVMGKVWRVIYTGDRNSFGEEQLARMEHVKQTASNIRTPHEVDDNLEIGMYEEGESLYRTYCAQCHQPDGRGAEPRYPPLVGSDWVTGDKDRLIRTIMYGMEGQTVVNGQRFEGLMPAHEYLSDDEIGLIGTYIRQNFGNLTGQISPRNRRVTTEDVRRVREEGPQN